ncbi:MAG: DUF1549 and DUF1553 domain-containing protein [Planctomycetota bacterium]
MRALLFVALCPLLTATVAAQQPASVHWSYRPIERPAVPAVDDDGFVSSPLDAFALAGMRAHDLQPSAPADRATWLRRVTLDLTGLPPTPEELDAFVADTAPGARERVVARLFDSDAFAERWTAWWLDLARYADSQGYEKDALRRGMWRYRDQVLAAFRRGQPFDEFTIEQLAGDLLPDATLEQQVATAFHRQTMCNTEGGTDDEEFRTAAILDRVDTTMSVWMGSTLGCAQCHDHKYDPFSQREFYRLFAFFDQTADADRDDDAPTMRAPTVEQQAAQKVISLQLEETRSRLATLDAERPRREPWQLLGPVQGDDFQHARTHAFAPEPERDGVQLEHEQEGLRWQPRPEFGDGKVHTWKGDNSAFYLYRVIHVERGGLAALSIGCDDALKVWWNGQLVADKDVAGAVVPDAHRVPVPMLPGDNTLLLKVTNGGGPGGFSFDLWTGDEVALRERLKQLEADFAANEGPRVPVMRELPADKRRTTRLHLRGSFLSPGEVVTMDTPAVWPPFPDEQPRDRLGLARWLMADDNPLTARVIANRLWSELWGRGIVATLEDFGTQGDAPTHPELLDWLACELRDSGWSLRHLLKTIVLSATYGQRADVTAQHLAHDVDNLWLARGASFRLSAEALRDQALAVSGLLRQRFGGESVMPPQPDGIWRQLYSGARWTDADGDDRYRRALYTFWRRTSPHPAMLVFDAQSREACVLRRGRTNTPLQALVLWNDPQFVEPAQQLGRELEQRFLERDDAARCVAWLWRRCLLREPEPREATRLVDLFEDERLAGASALQAWTMVASVVLSLDEFVTRR